MEQIMITIGALLGILVLFLLFKPRNVIGDTSKTQLETVGRQKNAATIAGEWVKGIFRKNEVEAKTPEEREKQKKEAARKNWLVLITLFIVAICIAYMLPDDSSMFFTLGVVVAAPLHIMGLWLLYNGSEVSDVTKTMVVGYFIIAVIGLILPEPMYQTWKDAKVATKTMNRPTLFKEMFSSSSPAVSTSTAPQAKTFWLPNVKIDNYGFTEVQIPRGAEVTFYCVNGGSQVSYWEGGPEEGVLQTCGEDLPMRARKKYGLRMEFSAATVEEVTNWQNNPEMSPPPLRESNVMIKVEA